MKSSFFAFLKKLPNEKYLFWLTVLFYIILLVANPPNKVIAFAFIFFFLALYLKIKNFSLSLLFVFIASLIIKTGKSYPIQLLPTGVFPEEIFPQGYFVHLVVTASHIISFVMLVYLIREFLLKKINIRNLKINAADILVLVFFILKILSAIIASKEPQLSLVSEILSIPCLVLYFYIRFLVKIDVRFWKMLVFLLCGLVVFESLLSFSQLKAKSPLYKNLEYQVNIEYFGKAIDEPEFTFRPVGTFDHANTLGIWLASVLIFLFAFIAKDKSDILCLSFLIGIFALVTTISRSAWLGFFVGIVTLLFLGKRAGVDLKFFLGKISRWRIFLVPSFIFSFFFFIIPRIEKSFYSFGPSAGAFFYRRIQIQDALEIIKLHPFFGVGALMSVYEGLFLDFYTVAASIPLVVHNWFLLITLKNGLLALFAFIFFVFLSVKNFWYISKKLKPEFLGTFSAVLCLFVAAIFQPYINTVFVFLLLSATNSDIIRS